MATAVAGAESSFNPGAVNPAAGGNYGLWQINAVHAALLRGRDWRNPVTNAWLAYQVWDAADGRNGDGRGSWTPWTTYTSGSYRSHLHSGAQPAPSGQSSAPPQNCTAAPAINLGIRVGTWNAQKTNSESDIAAGARDLSTQADVFGLQELSDPARRAAAARGAFGFTMTDDRTAVPIFYRTSAYSLLEQGRQLAFDQGQRIERTAGDHNSVTGRKWVTWVHLRDAASGADFYVLNTHMLVGAENTAAQRRANPRRVALYQRQLGTLTALADRFRASGAAVYATCDCNVNYGPDAPPVKTMRQHGLSPSWRTLHSHATHGKRDIDYVWSTTTPTSQVTGSRHGSDHAFLAVTYSSSAFSSAAVTTIAADDQQRIGGVRTVTDSVTRTSYRVPVPVGPDGRAIGFALDQLGDTWKWGSHGPEAWDCSGLTAAAWRSGGARIIAQSDAQHRTVPQVSLADARPGDIFWRHGYVGIYLGRIGTSRMVVGSLRASGAVVVHPWDDTVQPVVLRP